MGEKKLREFGAAFLAEIATHLQTNPRQMFADDSFAEPAAPMPGAPSSRTPCARRCISSGKASPWPRSRSIRGLKDGTIYGHLEEAMLAGEAIDVNTLVSAAAQRDIAAAFKKHGFGSLGPVVESLGGHYGYGQCRVVRAAMQMR